MLNHARTISKTGLAAGVIALAVTALPGCRGERTNEPPRQFFPDMDDGPKQKPQSQTNFFADGRAMRPRVENTVAFGLFSAVGDANSGNNLLAAAGKARTDLLREDTAYYRGLGPDGQPLLKIPVKVDAAMIDRGMERYGIYCASCHGYAGDGQGTVGVQWSAPVPSYYDPTFSDPTNPRGQDGHVFDVIRNGLKNPDGSYRMPAYGDKVDAHDAWAIVAWVRVMQESRRGQMSDVPEAQRESVRQKVEQLKAAAAAVGAETAPAAPATPATGGQK
jgi:mono/diheme cytochrome c family protein